MERQIKMLDMGNAKKIHGETRYSSQEKDEAVLGKYI